MSTNTIETTAGGPPGTHKVDKKVQKQLGELIAGTPSLAPQPKVSSKKALKWAMREFGGNTVSGLGARSVNQMKKWSVKKYTTHVINGVPLPKADEPKNDAIVALASGAVKRKEAKKAADRDADAKKRNAEIDTAMLALKLSVDEQAKNAMLGFINGPIKTLMDSFVKLFASRKTEGDSDEAVLAFDACIKAFDACGILLVDVKPTAKKPPVVKGDGEKALRELARKQSEGATIHNAAPKKTEKKERVRKELTKEQREAKNKADRARRAAKKEGK